MSISSLGVGSGLDAETIITKLMTLERQPINNLQTLQDGMKTQLSAIGSLQSLLSTMQDKARALTSLTLWGQTTATSSDSTVASASTSTGAATGSYQVTVQNLAKAQTVTSAAQNSAQSTLSEGTLTIDLGTWGGPDGFVPKDGSSPVSITIGPGDTSLAAIRDKINAAGAGVSATIVNDANGARLSLRSTETGAENGFRITATEAVDDGSDITGLSILGYDEDATSTPMQFNQAAENARALINGIDVESSTNTLEKVADGLTLTLSKVSASPVQITVANDTASVKSAITDFVTAFNALSSTLQSNLKYDSGSQKAGPLQGDRAAVSLQWALRGVINTPSSASSAFSVLSEIGIAMKQDGTLATTGSKLDAALQNPAELKKLLVTNGDTNASSGFIQRFANLASAMLDNEGAIELRQTSLEAAIKRNQKDQDAYEDRLTLTEKRLRAQYEALDTKMATLSTLANYVSQQFGSG